MAWELIEVPGNLNISLQDSTVDVVAAKIDPKLANTLISFLSRKSMAVKPGVSIGKSEACKACTSRY
ncbi:hypothetical protein ZEAMMB73_Zm00001d024999 [Zea mays]|uniref:Uncharacterized protein n=1 Tax=Zea mays TaxID=4577 RepID=A0A1D6J3S6_MAIZE|nr:hypothetical protein ZEAMMB73_Zm00001d024999 [Zea mays]